MKRERLIARRKQLGLTQEEIAKRIGIDRSSYTRFETGTRTPSLPVAIKIANILQGTVEDFFDSKIVPKSHNSNKGSASIDQHPA